MNLLELLLVYLLGMLVKVGLGELEKETGNSQDVNFCQRVGDIYEEQMFDGRDEGLLEQERSMRTRGGKHGEESTKRLANVWISFCKIEINTSL